MIKGSEIVMRGENAAKVAITHELIRRKFCSKKWTLPKLSAVSSFAGLNGQAHAIYRTFMRGECIVEIVRS